ncbi:hypothetical protein D0Z08_19405 [Nocardioides immobilis]|uniref:Uncharacterized protein n=1 Tax=Nocardioides immobilis TaxID=2049295 RepID=A0A417XYF5_9ACTN|nr:hypothetical protein [Nocardioides immobilis]RHW25397.1 hypothetical protein D0Z08_19405 [Nocardioides immobilis]
MTPEARDQTLVQIDHVLGEAGYVALDGPLTVGGVPFEVTRAYAAGLGFIDLVVVVDATDGTTKQLQRGYWLVERIARALDQAESRRPLTVVLLHDELAARVNTEDFLRLGRVLLVTAPDRVSVELAPILPIVIEPTAEPGPDPLDQLVRRHGGGQDAPRKVEMIEAAKLGPEQVQSRLLKWIDNAFTDEGGREDVKA